METILFVAATLVVTSASAHAKDKSYPSGTFNPQKNYPGVVLQQGRTTSDSDRTTSKSDTSGTFNPRKRK
jgi:hypothetical protein